MCFGFTMRGISYSVTAIPDCANCHAASDPQNLTTYNVNSIIAHNRLPMVTHKLTDADEVWFSSFAVVLRGLQKAWKLV